MAHARASQKTLISALPLRYLSAVARAVRRPTAKQIKRYVTPRSATMHYVHPKLRLMA